MKKAYQILLFLFFVTIFAGCGKNTQLGGTVTYDDGTPLTTGTVCFVTEAFYARGTLDDKGHYKLGTEKVGNGIPKGTYKVYIANSQKIIGSDDMGGGVTMPIMEETVAVKYHTPGTTDLSFVVDGSTKKFDFKVERP